MKKMISVSVLAAALFAVPLSHACVGRILYIGITGTANEKVLAEVTSVLINERTGSTVKIQSFKSSADLYKAIKQGQVSLLIENTDHALELLHRPKEANAKAAFDTAKSEYKKGLNLTWFEQFGGSRRYAPVLSSDTLANYPALPKLIGKLAGAINDDSFAKLSRSADSEDKLKKAAREFLKARKLI